MSEPRFDELLRRLAAAEVEFVVDVVVAADPENAKRLAGVAVEAGGHVQRGEKRAAGRTRDLADLEDLEATS